MKQNETKLGEKRETKYYCKFCYYSCGVKFPYDRHALTSKHLKHTQNETNETKKRKKRKTFLIIFVTAGKYIKDDNKWEKENEDKNKLRKVIKK